jgi:acetylglutamate kinase
MVLVGQVNSDVVSLVNAHGPFAVGLSGEDASLFTAERRDAVVDGQPVDVGLVGEVVDVRPVGRAGRCSTTGKVPVVATVARGLDGRSTTSTPTPPRPRSPSRSARRSSSCSPTSRGLYADWPASQDVISEIGTDALAGLLPSLASGMVPKMEACLRRCRAASRGARARRPGGAQPAARAVHRRGRRTMVVPS